MYILSLLELPQTRLERSDILVRRVLGDVLHGSLAALVEDLQGWLVQYSTLVKYHDIAVSYTYEAGPDTDEEDEYDEENEIPYLIIRGKRLETDDEFEQRCERVREENNRRELANAATRATCKKLQNVSKIISCAQVERTYIRY